MIDVLALSRLDKSVPLRLKESSGTHKCVLCDGPIGPNSEWVVTIPKHGVAHPHCAEDKGWESFV